MNSIYRTADILKLIKGIVPLLSLMILNACSNSSPTIKQLGTISGKLDIQSFTEEIYSPEEPVILSGTCDAEVVKVEVSGFDGIYRDITKIGGTVNCSSTQTFNITFTNATDILGSTLNSKIQFRAFTKSYETDPVIVKVTDKSAGQFAFIAFDSMTALSTVRSDFTGSERLIYSDFQLDKTKKYYAKARKIAFKGDCAGTGYQYKIMKKEDAGSFVLEQDWTNCSGGGFSYPSAVEAAGNWSVSADKVYTYAVTQRNPSVTTKADSVPVYYVFYIDTATPSTVAQTAPTNNVGDTYWSNSSITFTGSCEYNATLPVKITVTGEDATELATNTLACQSNNTFSFQTNASRTSSESTAVQYTFTQTDFAGNTSSVSTPFKWMYDKIAPGAPNVAMPYKGDGYNSGVSINSKDHNDLPGVIGDTYLATRPTYFYTKATTVKLHGSCVTGNAVRVNSSAPVTCSGGTFSIDTPSMSDGENVLSIYQKDIAGNDSPATNLVYVRDTAKPLAFTGVKSINDLELATGVYSLSTSAGVTTLVTNAAFSGSLPLSNNTCIEGAAVVFNNGSDNYDECSASGYSFTAINPADPSGATPFYTYTFKQIDLAASTTDSFASMTSDPLTVKWYKDSTLPSNITLTTAGPITGASNSSLAPFSKDDLLLIEGTCNYGTKTLDTVYTTNATKISYNYQLDGGAQSAYTTTDYQGNEIYCQSDSTFSFYYRFNQSGAAASTNKAGYSDFQTHVIRLKQVDWVGNNSAAVATVTWTRKNSTDAPTIDTISASNTDSKVITGSCEYIPGITTTVSLSGSVTLGSAYPANYSTACPLSGTYSITYTPNASYLILDYFGNGTGKTDDNGDSHAITVYQSDNLSNPNSANATATWVRDNFAGPPIISNKVAGSDYWPNSAVANAVGTCDSGGTVFIKNGASVIHTFACTGTFSEFFYGDQFPKKYNFKIYQQDALGNETPSGDWVNVDWIKLGRVSTFENHTFALKNDGSAQTWGLDGDGQRGDGDEDSNGFTIDPASAGPFGTSTNTGGGSETSTNNWLQISAGSHHSCGIHADHKLYCWGDNTSGQLGNNKELSYSTMAGRPRQIKDSATDPINTFFIQVAAGVDHTCAISDNYKLYCWGSDAQGRLGNGAGSASNYPQAIDSGNDYIFIAVGNNNTCGIRKGTKQLYCWGDNTAGKLGDGTTTDRQSATLINSGVTYSSVSLSTNHTCGVTTSGIVKCWGNDGDEVLGNAGSGNSNTPSSITLAEYISVSSGIANSCAIKMDNSLFCWGKNNDKFIVNDSTTVYDSPIDTGLTANSIALGKAGTPGHFCLADTSNNIQCWGDNANYKAGQSNSGTNYRIDQIATILIP